MVSSEAHVPPFHRFFFKNRSSSFFSRNPTNKLTNDDENITSLTELTTARLHPVKILSDADSLRLRLVIILAYKQQAVGGRPPRYVPAPLPPSVGAEAPSAAKHTAT